MMGKNNFIIEVFFVVIVFSILFYIGVGSLFGNNISHEKPVQYGAADGFLYAMLSNHVYEVGDFRYNPFYSTASFDDSIAYHPPLLMQIIAAFAHLSGLNAYDSLSLLIGLFVLFSAFMIYWLIRSYNINVALLSLPLFSFLYVYKFAIGYVWGEVLLLMGSFFLISLFFLMNYKNIKYWWLFCGLLIAATINTHTSETIFFYGFVMFFIVVKVLFKQISKEEFLLLIKQLFLATLFAIILSVNYLIIFYHGYYKITSQTYTSFKIMTPEEFGAIRVPPLYDFGYLALFFIILGLVVSVYLLKKQPHMSIISSLFMFLVGLTNYVGLHYRAFQTRFLWPIYLAVFFGLSIYIIINKFYNRWWLFYCVSLLILFLFIQYHYVALSMDVISDNQWSGFKWLEKDSPERSRILFFYGDGYSQSLRLIKRLTFLVDLDYLVGSLSKNQLKNELRISPILQDEMYLIYRRSFFDFGYYSKERNITISTSLMHVCDFDYYVVDKVSKYIPNINKVNMFVLDILVKNNISVVYENDGLVVLKNNVVGGNCLG